MQGVLRPDVVLFGEMLPADAMRELKGQLREGFDLDFSVGTTSAFPYVAFPVELAVQRGKPSVEINPGTTAVERPGDAPPGADGVGGAGGDLDTIPRA